MTFAKCFGLDRKRHSHTDSTHHEFIYTEPYEFPNYSANPDALSKFSSTSSTTPPPPLPERNNTNTVDTNDTMKSSVSKPSSLQLIQGMDMFQDHSDGSESFLLEDDHYVEEMKRRRGEIITKIDSNPRDRLRRKVGYEIERRLVKASYKKKKRKKMESKRHNSSLLWHLPTLKRSDSQYDNQSNVYKRLHRRERRRQRRHRHRFCIKCVTSSFKALFNTILYRPAKMFTLVNEEEGDAVRNNPNDFQSDEHESVPTPTPKILLGPDGKLQWPVFQVGGGTSKRNSHGDGMLISATLTASDGKRIFAPAPRYDPDKYLKQPGRENFSLLSGNLVYNNNSNSKDGNNQSDYKSSGVLADDDGRILGWLQVRDPRNRKHREYVPVVDPRSKGPFRKAPWHGNMHVLKF